MDITFRERWEYARSKVHIEWKREGVYGVLSALAVFAVLRLAFGRQAAEEELAAVAVAFLVGVVILPGFEILWHLFRAEGQLELLDLHQRTADQEAANVRLQEEVAELRGALDTRPFIKEIMGQVRSTSSYNRRIPYACVRVVVGGNGPCLNARGRLMSIEPVTGYSQGIPSGGLQWSAYDGGKGECTIDSEATLDILAVEHPNWATIIFADESLRGRRLNIGMGDTPDRFVATISVGGDNCSAVQERFLITTSVPRRTVDKDGVESIWTTPDWLPTVTIKRLNREDAADTLDS